MISAAASASTAYFRARRATASRGAKARIGGPAGAADAKAGDVSSTKSCGPLSDTTTRLRAFPSSDSIRVPPVSGISVASTYRYSSGPKGTPNTHCHRSAPTRSMGTLARMSQPPSAGAPPVHHTVCPGATAHVTPSVTRTRAASGAAAGSRSGSRRKSSARGDVRRFANPLATASKSPREMAAAAAASRRFRKSASRRNATSSGRGLVLSCLISPPARANATSRADIRRSPA